MSRVVFEELQEYFHNNFAKYYRTIEELSYGAGECFCNRQERAFNFDAIIGNLFAEKKAKPPCSPDAVFFDNFGRINLIEFKNEKDISLSDEREIKLKAVEGLYQLLKFFGQNMNFFVKIDESLKGYFRFILVYNSNKEKMKRRFIAEEVLIKAKKTPCFFGCNRLNEYFVQTITCSQDNLDKFLDNDDFR